MNDRTVTFASHRVDHAQRGHGIDERGGPLRDGYLVGKRQTLIGRDAAELRVHRTAPDGDFPSLQRTRGICSVGLDHRPRAFVANG